MTDDTAGTAMQQPEIARRRERMAVLAQSDAAALAECWVALDIDPQFAFLRGPETGLIALRGRMGGSGAPFNFGEATATRATVRLDSGAVGHAVILGRDRRKATQAAVIDALALDPSMAGTIDTIVTAPLQRAAHARDTRRAAEAAATRVDFFTMVRGEDT